MHFSVRRNDRHPVNADIRVATDTGQDLALSAIDLSRGGIGTDGLVQFDAETAVCVTFPDGTTRTGRSMWHEDFATGILFDQELSREEFDRLLRSLDRTPRFR